jgi:hypothetical protein
LGIILVRCYHVRCLNTADELATEWLKSTEGDISLGWSRLENYASEQPEVAFAAILCAVQFELTPDQLSVLAAGPLEILLSEHGPDFIERVESEAAHNPRFNLLLGGVWRLKMTEDVWSRVQKARRQTR